MGEKIELLAPAGSEESLKAAIYAGADSVYLGASDFNARKEARNFNRDQLKKAGELCRLFGVNLYVTLNTLVSDREEKSFLETAETINQIGADAVIVQDFGMARLLKEAFPDLRIHASTQMSICNLDGVLQAKKAGIDRVILSRELPLCDIAYICKNSDVEIEVFAHGALCVSFSGQCYFSGQIGQRSGNRGRCAQVCRMTYGAHKKSAGYQLSLKDLWTINQIEALKEAGVSSLKIEGRMKNPEYVAIVTSIYKRAIKTGRQPTKSDLDKLTTIFSRQGFTDGYLTGEIFKDMFGVKVANEKSVEYRELLSEARKIYGGLPPAKVGVGFSAVIRKGQPSRLIVKDQDGNFAMAEGKGAQPMVSRALGFSEVDRQLKKTGGTPYFVRLVETDIEQDVSLPLSALNDMRRDALLALSEKRKAPTNKRKGKIPELPKYIPLKKNPVFTLSFRRCNQITDKTLSFVPARIYLPLEEICANPEMTKKIKEKGIELCAVLPRMPFDSELSEIYSMIEKCGQAGITSVLCGNISYIAPLFKEGFKVYGDFGLNVFNSRTVLALKEMGLSLFTPSIELSLAQIRDLSKYIPAEIIGYGKMPMMLTRVCVIPGSYKNCKKCIAPNFLTDRKGESFPIIPEYNCRNEIFNSHPVYLSDKMHDLYRCDVESVRLMFTNEEDLAAERIFERYAMMDITRPPKFTRGLYYKGVE